MQKTSFGRIQKIINAQQEVVAEYLEFESEGREHYHRQYETFTVMTGAGQVVAGGTIYDVHPIDNFPQHGPLDDSGGRTSSDWLSLVPRKAFGRYYKQVNSAVKEAGARL